MSKKKIFILLGISVLSSQAMAQKPALILCEDQYNQCINTFKDCYKQNPSVCDGSSLRKCPCLGKDVSLDTHNDWVEKICGKFGKSTDPKALGYQTCKARLDSGNNVQEGICGGGRDDMRKAGMCGS